MSTKKQSAVFALVTLLFFMWGFITCMNDILIPFLKKVFLLTRAESMLVQFAFFGAYFIGSLIYFLVSRKFGDPIIKVGYKRSIVYGLFISALACILFYPAAEAGIFGLFLTALFILGLGFTLLQISANPYVAVLGPAESASSRLNFSQGFNSFGTTIAPIVGGYLVFHYFARIGDPLLAPDGSPILTDGGQPLSALGIQLPYLIFAAIFISLGIIFLFSHLPEINSDEDRTYKSNATAHKQLVFGMFAIFFYVGAEVSIGSALINYLNESYHMAEMEAKRFLALYWGGLMIGRFLGAISLSDKITGLKKYLALIVTSIAAFLVIYLGIYLESGMSLKEIWPYCLFMLLNIAAFALGRSKPARTLLIFSLVVIGLLALAMGTTGQLALWSVIAIGLFNSIMWSNIFTLAIDQLGKDTSQGSSLLVMMVVGGAILPWIMGFTGDLLGGYQMAFFIPMISYLYLAWYGYKGYQPGKFTQSIH